MKTILNTLILNISMKKPTTLKEALNNILTEEEMSVLRRAYDIVGDIAILEIPDELIKKEKQIAEQVLHLHKNVNVIGKKAGIHGGEFRTQPIKILAGEKRKIALQKENNVSLELDVEKVYFSPRLSTERKRISELVKDGEDILVMFSGCAPYPCVLSKNTKARSIIGVEKNPDGHRFGIRNIGLNKLHNVTLLNGDVREIVPEINTRLIGLKSSIVPAQLKERLKYDPHILELHLREGDLEIKQLPKTIEMLQKKGIHVSLHMPFTYDCGKYYSLAQKNIGNEMQMFRSLGKLCKKYHLKAVVHPVQNNGIAQDEDMLTKHIKLLSGYFDYFYFENMGFGLFSKYEDIIRIGKNAGVKNMCIDTCHLFIAYQNNDKIERHVKEVQKQFNTYFHLNDHDYVTHSCEIGKGFIDFSRVFPYVNYGVTEVKSKDENNPHEMIQSYLKVEKLGKKFDRVLMPLPKSAEDFLDTALPTLKKKGVLHFYDFLHVDYFYQAEEKIAKACKKHKRTYKVLDLVKCGQHAPRVFRICLDVKIE
jgi:tRNA G37 N-methylase Trm5